MSVKNFRVEHCTIQDIREFIETNHYSGTVNGLRISHCFALENKMEIPAYGWFTVSCVFLTGTSILNELEYYLTAKHFDDTMQAKFHKENPHVTESLSNH